MLSTTHQLISLLQQMLYPIKETKTLNTKRNITPKTAMTMAVSLYNDGCTSRGGEDSQFPSVHSVVPFSHWLEVQGITVSQFTPV